MDALLPRALLNRFYVVLLVINCWSSPLVDIGFHKQDEARRRFACVALDCLLDLMACMGIQLIVLLAYVDDYDPGIKGFDGTIWYNDEWVARALNEFQIIVVVSWSDLVSRAVFSLGLFITTMSMKKLILQRPRCSNRIIFGVWGFVILGLHIHASLQPTLPQCLMQVSPWTASRPSCYLAGLDCHTLGISGSVEQVLDKWSEFDAFTVVQLLIRHCPALEVPHIFSDFHNLRVIKVYNTTIIDWGESAAITNTNHPYMASLFIVRVNMTDGVLPAGFQSEDFPQSLNDIEICVTNLRDLPSDLDVKWAEGAIIQVEYSRLETLPLVLARLKPYYLYLTGNPISDLPPEILGVDGMVSLGMGDTNVSQLPPNVTDVSPSLSLIEIDNTNISFFWSWVDGFVGRTENPGMFVAGGSFYCEELEQIEENSSSSFQVSPAPEYSSVLMDPFETNRGAILRAVDCTEYDIGPYYPLEFDDGINAITAPPPFGKHR
ncbi:hypothetical protein PHYSODRAFT_317477 [Phytophthora sojae]|uniref:Uncharacterized protein n=1 Tax=Phytophthora sojae (strain P6497) TaxID=1094619 RepID=G4ZWE8_PHYSP|nr:hypothetical protein PHYSODRAFT_317477 [Phytophthora sojae]EGZ12376.1 hypothetical protein PHYSODRAFT_317477 [Phytophthora sojae]|eukprot:XP_009532709.1 hypothetical protein PHYSODRAFT_317477 [Phytophthora sojae]